MVERAQIDYPLLARRRGLVDVILRDLQRALIGLPDAEEPADD
jgi:hypothetical protein